MISTAKNIPVSIPIAIPFSFRTFANKKLSRNEEKVRITVVSGISIYSGVSILIITKATRHRKNPKVATVRNNIDIKLISIL